MAVDSPLPRMLLDRSRSKLAQASAAVAGGGGGAHCGAHWANSADATAKPSTLRRTCTCHTPSVGPPARERSTELPARRGGRDGHADGPHGVEQRVDEPPPTVDRRPLADPRRQLELQR